MRSNKKAGKIDKQDYNALVEKVSDVAKLSVRSEDRMVGVRNLSIPIWITARNGRQQLLQPNEATVIDYYTFRHTTMNQDCWKMGCIVRDDSVLSSSDVPGEPTEISVNAITDEQLQKALDNEKYGLGLLEKLTSRFAITRLREAASKARPKRNAIIEECDNRLFMLENELPTNFNKLSALELAKLIEMRHFQVDPEFGDTADSIREKILEFLAE